MLHGFEKTCTKYNELYGPVVECWLNGEKVILVSSPDLVKYITIKNGKNYLKRFTSKEVLDASVHAKVEFV